MQFRLIASLLRYNFQFFRGLCVYGNSEEFFVAQSALIIRLSNGYNTLLLLLQRKNTFSCFAVIDMRFEMLYAQIKSRGSDKSVWK